MLSKIAIWLLLSIIAKEKETMIAEDLPHYRTSYWRDFAIKACDAWRREKHKMECLQRKIETLSKIPEEEIINPALASYKVRERNV